jgi:hypothetical protein
MKLNLSVFFAFLLMAANLCCIEDNANKIKLIKTIPLPDNITESSGLALHNSLIITHNDKGNSADIFGINPDNGALIQTITLPQNTQNDWEDMAQNDSFLFISNTGNNKGKRTSFNIIKLPISLLGSTAVNFENIVFTYPLSEKGIATQNPDCEALFYANKHLFLLTKEREKPYAYLYQLPSVAGTYQARLIDSIKTGFWITGADYCQRTQTLAVLGYLKEKTCSVLLFPKIKWSHNIPHLGEAKAYHLGRYAEIGQMEGILLRGDTLLVSNEKTKTASGAIQTYLIKH